MRFRLNPAQKNQSITLISTLRFSISPHARLNSFHSNVTKCCACHENCKDRITKCCACHENCKDRITKCCTCHENCKDRITKCCACHESCKDRITKYCACHENCKDRITKCCAGHKNCKGRITTCCACHENCKSRITKENSPKWIGWMEARWMGFSFWLNIYHSWYLPWRQKQALFLTWKRASGKATGTVLPQSELIGFPCRFKACGYLHVLALQKRSWCMVRGCVYIADSMAWCYRHWYPLLQEDFCQSTSCHSHPDGGVPHVQRDFTSMAPPPSSLESWPQLQCRAPRGAAYPSA